MGKNNKEVGKNREINLTRRFFNLFLLKIKNHGCKNSKQ